MAPVQLIQEKLTQSIIGAFFVQNGLDRIEKIRAIR